MTTLTRSNFLRTGALLATLTLIGSPAWAAYPDKPIKLVVPFAPGGGTDLVARTLAAGMSKEIGGNIIIDNRPGAGTVIGTDAVAKSAPDGYTLVISTFAHAANPSLMSKLPYDTAKAFTPVVLIGRGPNVLTVRADSPYKTVQDVINAAKAEPGKLTYASQGNGTSAHLAGEMFTNLAKVKMVHVPYRGASPAITDLLGGQVNMIFGTAAGVSTFVNSGKLRAIAVTSAERSKSFKNVPTIGETVPGYVVESWYGLYAPAGTPPDIVAKLNAAANKASHQPDFAKKVEEEGLTISSGPPADLDKYVRSEEARWARIVKENNIKLD